MKFVLIFLLSVSLTSYTIGQEKMKDINFVIVVDEKILTGVMERFKIIANLKNGTNEKIEVDYCPGNLSLKQSDYEKLIDTNVKTIYLAFDYIEYSNKKQKIYNYEIDIRKGWLEHYYYVLYVYNTDKKQYKNSLEPLFGKNYTYEFDYPGGSVKRVRKKL